jgi:hypothetical protein
MEAAARFESVPDSQNTNLQIGIRMSCLIGAVTALCAIVLWVLGVLTRNQGLYILACVALGIPFLSLWFRANFRGTVFVEPDRLRVRSYGTSYTYPWSDIAFFTIEERSLPGSAWLLRTLRIHEVPFIAVQLKKHSRLGLLRSGTDVIGIPQVNKRLELRVRDVPLLAAALAPHAATHVR